MRPAKRRTCSLAVRLAGAVAVIACCSAPPALADSGSAPGNRSALGRVERYVDDSLLTARVKLALLDAPDVSALEIGVQTQQGVVQLSGFVEDARRAARAVEIAKQVLGVLEVRSALQVKGRSS